MLLVLRCVCCFLGYNPDCVQDETLPRYSSGNFTQDEIGKPLFSVSLEPGDLLYMPRGVIHQAVTHEGNQYSLHVTVSTAQRHAWYAEPYFPFWQPNLVKGTTTWKNYSLVDCKLLPMKALR